jgi:hypothetical protein
MPERSAPLSVAPTPRRAAAPPRTGLYRRVPLDTPGGTVLCGIALTVVLVLLLRLYLTG